MRSHLTTDEKRGESWGTVDANDDRAENKKAKVKRGLKIGHGTNKRPLTVETGVLAQFPSPKSL